ncbi:Gfo/Idh/MocA family oxidoreductase [Amycolatopsis sp. NPDC051372]|uniref:Gfo/Idh/MocA family protein n=1 Tax=Amycolatopsis sp. NPDC051372 TaxID=3155669 RepID=UPI00344A3AD1
MSTYSPEEQPVATAPETESTHRAEDRDDVPLQPVRVGLVGANWGLAHLAGWRAAPGVDVVAVCTAHRDTAEKVASQQSIPAAYWRVEDLIADATIDLVDVTVRPAIRAPMGPSILRAGKHLLQPLPFALDLAQGRSLRDEGRATGRVSVVESLHRHEPAARQFKHLIDTGLVGEVRSIRGHVRSDILLSPPANWSYEWIVEPRHKASALRNFGAHLLHTLVWLFGPVAELCATLSQNITELVFADGRRKPNGTKDHAALLMRMESGADASLDVSWGTPAAEGFGIEAIGTAGRLILTADRLGPQNARLLFAGLKDTTLGQLPVHESFRRLADAPAVIESAENPRFFATAAMCHSVAQQVRGNTAECPGPSFAEGYYVMSLVEAAYHSAEARCWVRPDPLEN